MQCKKTKFYTVRRIKDSLLFFLSQEAECDREKQDARFKADTQIANSSRAYQMEKASFDQEVNTKTAEAELAYELQVIVPLITDITLP